jgi:hypothetical protein
MGTPHLEVDGSQGRTPLLPHKQPEMKQSSLFVFVSFQLHRRWMIIHQAVIGDASLGHVSTFFVRHSFVCRSHSPKNCELFTLPSFWTQATRSRLSSWFPRSVPTSPSVVLLHPRWLGKPKFLEFQASSQDLLHNHLTIYFIATSHLSWAAEHTAKLEWH